MGWSFGHKPKGKSVRDQLQQDWGNQHTIVESAMVGFTEFYAAVKNHNTQETLGVVVLIRFDSSSYYNFGTKTMDETMGPGYHRAPRRVMEALDEEAPNEWAKAWREDCWKYIEYKESLPSLSKGDMVRFHKPIKFSTGTYDTFEFLKGSTFRGEYGGLFRITNFREPGNGFNKLEECQRCGEMATLGGTRKCPTCVGEDIKAYRELHV